VKGKTKRERKIEIEKGLLCAGPVQKAGSFLVPESPFCRRHFCGFNFSSKPPTRFFKKLWSGGRAVRAVRVGSRASSCDAAGGSAAPPQPLSGCPPLFFSLARACNLLAFFFSGQSFGRCAPLAQLRGRRAEKK
jgi:hypothetical protein